MPLTAAAAAAIVVMYGILYLIAALRMYESSCVLVLADRRVDHELDLAVLDGVDDIRPALVHLENLLGLDAVLRTGTCTCPPSP